MPSEFKPNIYPIMYWALAFGATAGVLLFLLRILSEYISLVWFPVFLVGLIWGGFRNYQTQKKAWEAQGGTRAPSLGVVDEFKHAVTDIANASQELLNQEAEEAQAQLEQGDEIKQQSTPPPAAQ